jgi:hypothetical protein
VATPRPSLSLKNRTTVLFFAPAGRAAEGRSLEWLD